MRILDGHLVRIPHGEVKRQRPSGGGAPLYAYEIISLTFDLDCSIFEL